MGRRMGFWSLALEDEARLGLADEDVWLADWLDALFDKATGEILVYYEHTTCGLNPEGRPLHLASFHEIWC